MPFVRWTHWLRVLVEVLNGVRRVSELVRSRTDRLWRKVSVWRARERRGRTMILKGFMLRQLRNRITVDSQDNHTRASWPLGCHLLQEAGLGRSWALITRVTTRKGIESIRRRRLLPLGTGHSSREEETTLALLCPALRSTLFDPPTSLQHPFTTFRLPFIAHGRRRSPI